MEGDAGASRLNPPPMPTNRRLRRRNRTFRPNDRQESENVADETTAQLTPAASTESEGGADETAPLVPADEPAPEATVEQPAGSEGGAEQTMPVRAEEPAETEEVAVAGAEEADAAAPVPSGVARRPSRMGRGWLAGIAAVLVVCAAALGLGAYFGPLRYHKDAQATARDDEAALKAALDCVTATQAPDTNAMAASQQKIIDCGTDAFRSQALLYASQLVVAYQASNVHVQVADARGAVERNQPDGSIDVLVAMRVKVASGDKQNEVGYRLRVTMAMAEGQYRISKLDQVTK